MKNLAAAGCFVIGAAVWLGADAQAPVAPPQAPLSGLPPKLATVIVWVALAVPRFCENVNVGGEKLIAEGRGGGSGMGVAPKT